MRKPASFYFFKTKPIILKNRYERWRGVASSKVEKELAKIPKKERERIINRIRRLAENPRPSGIKALVSNVYRLRIGACRVICKVYGDEKIVLIVD